MSETRLLTLRELGLDGDGADLVLEALEANERLVMYKAEKSPSADRPVISLTPSPKIGESVVSVLYRTEEQPYKETALVHAVMAQLFEIAEKPDFV